MRDQAGTRCVLLGRGARVVLVTGLAPPPGRQAAVRLGLVEHERASECAQRQSRLKAEAAGERRLRVGPRPAVVEAVADAGAARRFGPERWLNFALLVFNSDVNLETSSLTAS